MGENIKAAWIGAGATVVAALIAAAVALYLTLSESQNALGSAKDDGIAHPSIADSKSAIGSDSASEGDSAQTAEENIDNIFIGMGKSYAKKLFGVPEVELKHEVDDSVEFNYVFEKFYLQLIFDESESLKFYSIVSRDKEFHPCIPKLNRCLGKNTFYEMSIVNGSSHKYSHTYVYSYLTSKHYGYGEYLYLGNAGNYQNYYLGFNSLGVDYGDTYPFTKYGKTDADWEDFRAKSKPNAFGIGDISQVKDDDLHYEIGPEYYTFRYR